MYITHGGPMGTHGNPWGPKGTQGDPWGPMGTHGNPWGPMTTLLRLRQRGWQWGNPGTPSRARLGQLPDWAAAECPIARLVPTWFPVHSPWGPMGTP